MSAVKGHIVLLWSAPPSLFFPGLGEGHVSSPEAFELLVPSLAHESFLRAMIVSLYALHRVGA